MATRKGDDEIIEGENDGYLSEESDFYGDETIKRELEARAAAFSLVEWWKSKPPSLMEISSQNLRGAKGKMAPRFYNAYEGISYARQLTETTEEFLERLPPATTPLSQAVPWIFIANPYWKTKQPCARGGNREDLGAEGPLNEDTNLSEFGYLARRSLLEFARLRREIAEKNTGKSKTSITKLLNAQRSRIVKDVLDGAVNFKVTSGKWMIFASFSELNYIWAAIVKATTNNELGTAAKVAPDEGDRRKERLICIYTYDFTDVDDVTRVVRKLKDMGLVDSRGKGIYYKCDAYTHLGLTSDNNYGIKASMYNSNDVLRGKTLGVGTLWSKGDLRPHIERREGLGVPQMEQLLC